MAQPATTPQPDPNEKLVKVFDSEQESEAMVVKGLLDSASIESDLASASLLQDAFPGLGGMIILVREEDAEKALRLISESRRDQPSAEDATDDETEEIDTRSGLKNVPKRE
jgi:Putative prokaryotic signal transducing protein